MSIKGLESIERSPGSDGLSIGFCQTFKEEEYQLNKAVQETEEEETPPPKSVCKASSTLTPKPDKHIARKRQTSISHIHRLKKIFKFQQIKSSRQEVGSISPPMEPQLASGFVLAIKGGKSDIVPILSGGLKRTRALAGSLSAQLPHEQAWATLQQGRRTGRPAIVPLTCPLTTARVSTAEVRSPPNKSSPKATCGIANQIPIFC